MKTRIYKNASGFVLIAYDGDNYYISAATWCNIKQYCMAETDSNNVRDIATAMACQLQNYTGGEDEMQIPENVCDELK